MSNGQEQEPPPEQTTLTLGGVAEAQPEKKSIGPYQVIRKMGQGGMGAVYLGVRVDQEFRKHVAIKVIRTGLDSDEVVARFRRERQILASLDHPNIAHLIDAGTTDDGLPYFVMEYVQGRPLTDYCDSHKLTLRERLELFRSVCSAVQQAHQNLVVHRDLKPANVLVTADGKAKLLDFGIAKLLNPDVYPGELPPTATDMRVMTPDYASPEQVRGDPIATSSDVYSLGVILYELLAGRRPYQFTGSNQAEIFRIISEQEPRRPSTAITSDPGADTDRLSTLRGGTTERLQKELRGDLDNIVLMALRKEPQRRYASAEALSEDIRRYLDGHPVAASKGTWSYRAQKYVRRHKAAVAAAAVVAVLLIAFSIVLGVQNVRIASERDAARKSEQKAVAVTDFLVNLFETNDPAQSKGESLTARQLLDRGASRLQKDFKEQPEIQAELMNEVGRLYESLGTLDQAESQIRQALGIRRSRFGSSHLAVAESLHSLGKVLTEKGQYGEAEKVLSEALATRRKLLGSEHTDVARTLGSLAEVQWRKGQLDEAERSYREALAMHRRLLGNEHEQVANDMGGLGLVLQDKNELDEAERLFRESLAMHRKLLGNEDPNVAASVADLAQVLWNEGHLDEAEELYREGLALDRKLMGNEHPSVAVTLNNLALVLAQKGELDEADRSFREALAIRRKALGNEHPGVAITLRNLGLVLQDKGEPREAEALFREALAMDRKLLGPEHPRVAADLITLAGVRQGIGQRDDAERLYREALAMSRKLVGDGHPLVAASLAGLAETLLSAGQMPDAKSAAEEVLASPEKKLPADSKYRARAKSALGGVLLAERHYPEAEPLLLDAYRILSVQERVSPHGRRCQQRLVDLYKAWGKPAKLAEYQKLAVAAH
jgi:eukaryotic-like serine/threonine-protein kinase